MLKHLLFLVFIFLFSNSLADNNQQLLQYIETDYKISDKIIIPRDFAIGDIKAPVVIIDYSSFSCVHCQYLYNEILSKLKEKYIDTGKVLLILRDFPLDSVSLKASLLIKYYESKFPSSKGKHDNILNLISKLFDTSIKIKDPDNFDKKLYQIAKDDMLLSKHDFDIAMNNTDIKNKILYSKLTAIKELKLRGTPTVYINGKEYRKNLNLKSFEETIDEILSNNK
jgi:protein-disulfide isomerase